MLAGFLEVFHSCVPGLILPRLASNPGGMLPVQLTAAGAASAMPGPIMSWATGSKPSSRPKSKIRRRRLRPGGHRDEDGRLLFSPRTIGPGSFSFSVSPVDLENKIVVAQVREKNSKADAKWYPKFLREVRRMTGGEQGAALRSSRPAGKGSFSASLQATEN